MFHGPLEINGDHIITVLSKNGQNKILPIKLYDKVDEELTIRHLQQTIRSNLQKLIM